MKVYPSVRETLLTLKDKGVLIVAYTESLAFYSKFRIKRLGLDGVIDFLYSAEDHRFPDGIRPEDIRSLPQSEYECESTIHRHTPLGEIKPNPQLLLDIIKDIGAEPDDCIYVGDSLHKDIKMAQDANVHDVLAEYGIAHRTKEYELLRSVTHWTNEDVQREKELTEVHVTPTYKIKSYFCELLVAFNFRKFNSPKMISEKDLPLIIDIWKKIIDVQQHFNDIEMKIRNVAISITGAFLGVSGFMVHEIITVPILGEHRLSSFILFASFIVWGAFFFMDKYWYHRLLYGAIKQGQYIEDSLEEALPQICLTKAIGKESPLTSANVGWIPNWKCTKDIEIHSNEKFNLFYGGIGLLLLILSFLMFFLPIKNETNEKKQTVTKIEILVKDESSNKIEVLSDHDKIDTTHIADGDQTSQTTNESDDDSHTHPVSPSE